MKPSIICGLVIVILIVAAAILSPQFRSATSKAADQAREEAVLAQRLLSRYDYRLRDVGRLADPNTLKEADFDALAEKTREDVQQLSEDYSAVLDRMKRDAEADRLPEPTLDLPAASPSGLKRALGAYESALRDNDNLLNQAAQHARNARSGVGNTILGVPQIAGTVEYTRAAGLLADAQVLRRRQELLQARLLRLGGRWKSYLACQDYEAGLDVTGIISGLREDLDEVRQLHAEATSAAAALAEQTTARQQELAAVEQELQQGRAKLLTLEQQGFTAGDDESFNAYRDKYLELSNHLRERQEREQLLRSGGRDGASFAGDELDTAEIEGGEVVVGLEKLERRLTAAQEKVRRLGNAVTTLEGHISVVEQTGQAAQQGEQRYAELLEELDADQKKLLAQVLSLAEEASQKEIAALKAARDAASAFRSEQQAADRWIRDAREVQSDLDPERKNPRLTMIVGDRYIPQIGSSAEAAALILVGRVHAQRIEANQSLIDNMRIFVELRPGTTFAADELRQQINTSREEAIEQLTKAGQLYERLVSRSPEATKWIPQAGLAAVYHLLARINPPESATYLSRAAEAVEEATRGREESPYLSEHVAFRDHLRERAGLGAPEPEEEGEDIFDDEGSEEEG